MHDCVVTVCWWTCQVKPGIHCLQRPAGLGSDRLAESIGIDRDISEVGGSAGAIHQEAIAYNQIMHSSFTEGKLSVQVDIPC